MNIGANRPGGGTGKLSCEQAKQMDMVDYLATLGYHPSKIKNNDYWYCSPLRKERTPSFKINLKQNVWYDHGIGQGGNLVDFGVLYHNCSVKELLEMLEGTLSFHQPVKQNLKDIKSPIKILSERAIVTLSLLRYLKQRRIVESIAKKYCSEISFSINGKVHSAIGFRNDEGGFELRNQCFKGSSSPKAITSLDNCMNEVSVFEGFFNFLTFQTINQNQAFKASNFLILNSTSFFEKSRLLMEGYDAVHLFLDRDNTGQKLTQMALSWSKKFKDESALYKGYNDLNEWMQQIGKSMKKGLSQ